jgi:hypothetical protein
VVAGRCAVVTRPGAHDARRRVWSGRLMSQVCRLVA